MSNFPHSLLLLPPSAPVVVISGPHIQTLDTTTGDVLSSTLNSNPEVTKSIKQSGPIRYAVIDGSNTHLATLADDKRLKVWKIDGLELLHERELPKRPTSACFTADGQTIVVADKFGDVFSYPLHPTVQVAPAEPEIAENQPAVEAPPEPSTSTSSPPSKKKRSKKPKTDNPPKPRDSIISHPAAPEGTLILGHTSLLTTFLLTSNNQYIITADRDEHIRVSWYPQGYCIESYCLGSTQFVSAIHIPSFDQSSLISGGGDHVLKIWDWMTGALKHDIPILVSVKDFIRVKIKPYKRKKSGDNENVDDSREGTEDVGAETDNGPASTNETSPDEETVLSVHKIRSYEYKDKKQILFSVTGGSALFCVAHPEKGSTTVDSPKALDLGSPILDFAIDAQGLVWICVDVNWTVSGEPSEEASVRLAKMSEGGELIEVASDSLPTPSLAVLQTLNTKCRITASTEELSSLSFYTALSTLPKNNSGEDEDGEGDPSRAGTPQAGTGIPKSVKTSTRRREGQGAGGGKKEIGKQKSKKAVEERKRLMEQKEGGIEEEGERESKRTKSVDDTLENSSTAPDVDMADI